MKYSTNSDDIPSTTHFAAIVYDSIYIPGDERSRTNPGHGYPAHNETVIKYIVFSDKQDMMQWVNAQETGHYQRDNYRIIEVTPRTVILNATVQ